jgi:hypothetical protein
MSEQSNIYAGYGSATPPDPPGGGEDASVKDRASESAQAGKQAASDVAQTATDQVKNVATEAQSQARNLVGEARDQLRSHAGDQHRNAVTNLRSLGDELHSMAMSSEQNGVATELVSKAADRTHGVADWLDGRQPEELLQELRRFARRRPGAFLLGALAAGVVAGRLTRGAVAAHGDDTDTGGGTVGRRPLPGAGDSSTTGTYGNCGVPVGGYGTDPAYGSAGSGYGTDPTARVGGVPGAGGVA